MATKKELEDQVKLLKDEIRKLRSEAKETNAKSETMKRVTYGAFVDDDGQFKMATVRFNEEDNSAIVEEVKTLQRSLTFAANTIKRACVDALLESNKRR